MSTCFDNIIGLSQTTCDCVIPFLPEDYSESESGLYMDELAESPIDLKAVLSIEECGKDIGQVLSLARTQAIFEFRRDLFKQFQTRFQSRYKPYVGDIGGTASRGNHTYLPTSVIAGLRIESKGYRGVYLTIKSISTYMQNSATFDLKIYRIDDCAEGGMVEVTLDSPITLESIAGQIKKNVLTTPIVLPLYNEGACHLKYLFVYDISVVQAKDTAASCGCSRERDLRYYLHTKGVEGASASSYKISDHGMGLILDSDISCGTDDLICRTYYENEFIQQVMEWAILRKAVHNVIQNILHSSAINRYTMSRREQMYDDGHKLNSQYKNDVEWIAENVVMTTNDCYVCNEKQQPMMRTGIIS